MNDWLDRLRRRMSGWGRGAMGRFAAKDADRYEALSAKRDRVDSLRNWPRYDEDGPATTPAAVMADRRAAGPVREDLAAAGRRKEPGPARDWFESSVNILLLGFFYQLVGTLMVRFLGFGGFLITLGALMVIVGIIGIWLTPLVWLIDAVAKGLKKDDQPAW